MTKAKAKPSTSNQPQNPWQEWDEAVTNLCHKLFMQNEEGRQLLQLWENRYFRNPVVVPEKDTCYTYMNEGRNDFLRMISIWINKAANGQQPKKTQIKRRGK